MVLQLAVKLTSMSCQSHVKPLSIQRKKIQMQTKMHRQNCMKIITIMQIKLQPILLISQFQNAVTGQLMLVKLQPRHSKHTDTPVASRQCVQHDQADAMPDPLPRAPSSQYHTTEVHSSPAAWTAGTTALQDFHGSLQQIPYTVHAVPYHVQMNPVKNNITHKPH